ncbi:MAG TPA: YidC/Oxa1 family membrane protein insertase [Candidatus Saccharimonadales bacterium]|nr:YidC/Oxa1 family membrane protein insertase [Candidatus Saccharimonadales bacterium]
MFTTLIVQPIFNLLVLVYGLIPGHNFGLSLIIFTIIVRLLMWPLVKRQLHQTKVMRKLQPELKRIKQETKGNKQKESMMMMELYKERGVNPIATLPILVVQLVILIGLYSGLNRVIHDPKNIYDFAYPALQHMGWMQHLSHHPKDFDNTFFGIIDLTRSALGPKGTYIPALLLVVGSAVVQFLTSRQLMPTDKNARKLRQILKEAGNGGQADQTEVNAAVGRSTQYLIPFMVFLFTVNLASALSLYWLTGGIVALIQQTIALRDDETEMEKQADAPDAAKKKDVSKIKEAEVVAEPVPQKAKTTKSKSKSAKKKSPAKRRKK